MTTMTIEQIRRAREQGQSKTDWALLRQNNRNGFEPEEDDDSLDATLLTRKAIERRRAERLTQRGDKEQVAIRVDKDILAFFRATGSGWQTRLNAALREWLAAHSHMV